MRAPPKVAVTSLPNSASAPEKQENAFAQGPALSGTPSIHIFIHCLWRIDYVGHKADCGGNSGCLQSDADHSNNSYNLD